MKIQHEFSKELLDAFYKYGTIVSEMDGDYFNLPQWYHKDATGKIYEVPYSELPEQAQQIQLKYRDYKRVFTIDEMRECFYAPIHNEDIGRCDTFAEFITKRFNINLQKK